MKTVIPKAETVQIKWYLVNGEQQLLGRLASQIAFIVRGKHKPEFTPHMDLGDHVVVINADKVKVTGRKEEMKKYIRYTGFPGGLRSITFNKLMQKSPEKVLYHAVKGMLPKNRLGRKMMKKVRIYSGPDHPHQAQKPEAIPEYLRRS